MVKKKNFKTILFEYGKYPTLIVACLAALGIMYRYGYKWLTVPERVEAAEEKIETIEDYVKEQRISNELMKDMFQQQFQQQQQQPYCEIYEGSLWCWDEQSQQWYEVRQ